MKSFTLKSLLLVACMAVGMGAKAQTLTFSQDRDFRDLIGWPAHRALPQIMDFNNDGIMDAYYGGTSCVNGWTARGVLIKGLGNGQYQGEFTPKYETYMSNEPVVKRDGEGNPITDDDGNVVYETDENGDIVYEQVERQRIVGMENGLPFSIRGYASQPIDYNQDGFVDMLLQSDGGNDTGQRQGIVLVKNNGDYTFEVVFDDFFASLPTAGAGNKPNGNDPWGGVAIADYDKDGYPDILYDENWSWDPLTDQWGRGTRLLHNLKGEGFEVANVCKPLPFDKELNRRYIYVKTDDQLIVDEDGVEQTIPGEYINEPTFAIKPIGGGNVVFVDLNNDGWKDIVIDGWADGDNTEPGGYEIRYYENLQDGWFQDATDKLFESAGVTSLADLWNTWGGEDHVLLATDWNQDGREDLLLVGSCVGHNGKQAFVLLNASTPEAISVQELPTSLIPTSGISDRCFFFADFNGDDICDMLAQGWSDYNEHNDWAIVSCESTGSIDAYNAEFLNNGSGDVRGAFFQEGMTGFGDLDNDGKLDFLCTTWTDKMDDLIPSYNKTEYTVEAPEAPQNVNVSTEEDGTMKITWDGVSLLSGGEAMYNVYVVNNATGQLRMVAPANLETGKQLGYSRFGTYVYSGGEGEPSYVVPGLPTGEYTVGVQAVSYSYQASAWTTTTASVDDGTAVRSIANEKMNIAIGERAITVTGVVGTPVQVYALDGKLVGSGVTNNPIAINGRGVYAVKVGKKVAKIVK